MRLPAVLTTAAFFVFAVTRAEATDYDVYLAAGQSNMDGRGATDDLTGNLAPFKNAQTDVKIWYSHRTEAPSGTGWVAMRPGYSTPPGYNGALPSGAFGPEVSFGRAMADASPGKTVAVLKVAEGATSLSFDWRPTATGRMYDFFIDQTQDALAALAGPGDTVTVRGMIWHQGESDSGNTSQADYDARLTAFVDAVRVDLDLPALPFVVGELEEFNHGTNVPLAQLAVGTRGGYSTGFADSAGLATSDGTHFTAAAQIALGQRFAASMQSVPEPTIALLAAPALALGLRRRRATRDACGLTGSSTS